MRKNTDTDLFKYYYSQLKGVAFRTNDELAKLLGYKRGNSITEIIQGRQNIQTEKYIKFTEVFKDHIDELESGGEQDVGYYKDKIIELQEKLLKDRQEIIFLQKELLDKSSQRDPNIKNDTIQR